MKIVLSLSVILVLLAGCGPSQEEIATQTSSALTSTAAVWTKTITPTSTNTATPTNTTIPTLTSTPTSTPFAGYLLDRLIAYKINWTGPSNYYTGDIVVSLPNGDNPINLTKYLTGNKILGGWSPDGNWILFGRWEEGSLTSVGTRNSSSIELWKMSSDGNNRSRLPIDILANDVQIIGSQRIWDGENLIMPCATGGDQTELCIVNVADSTVKKTGNYGEDPSYAPDRNAYAWQFNYDLLTAVLSDQNLSDLFVIKKGERYAVKLPMPTKKLIEGYGWLSDSKSLIVLFREKNLNEIYEIQADGRKEPVLILSIKSKFQLWQWRGLSQDGNYLLIEDVDFTGKGIGCIVNLFEKTTVCLNQGYSHFIWTPDGQFAAQKDGIAFVIDLATGDHTQTDQLIWLFSQPRVLSQP